MLALASAANMVAATPRRLAIFWPTTASTVQSVSASTALMRPALMASLKLRARWKEGGRGEQQGAVGRRLHCADGVLEAAGRRGCAGGRRAVESEAQGGWFVRPAAPQERRRAAERVPERPRAQPTASTPPGPRPRPPGLQRVQRPLGVGAPLPSPTTGPAHQQRQTPIGRLARVVFLFPRAHRAFSASSAFSVSALLTAKQTECSDEAWLIMMTLTLLSRITLRERWVGQADGGD